MHPLTGDPRIVFVPSHLSRELQAVEDDLMQILPDSTVMVPKHPAALDDMPEATFGVADDEIEALDLYHAASLSDTLRRSCLCYGG